MAEDMARSGGATLRGRVRIDAPASIGHRYMLQPVLEFRTMYPEVEIDLSFGDRPSILRADGFDILVRIGDPYPDLADARLLGQTRFVHVASPAYLERRGTPTSPQDLETHDCITYSTFEQPGGWSWSFERDGEAIRVRVPSPLSFNDGAAIGAAAAAGHGIARTLKMLVADQIADGRLKPVLEQWSVRPIPIRAFAAADRSKLPTIQAVLSLLQGIDWTGGSGAEITQQP